jgi:membrane fusion protein, multidrug efflux system
MMRAVSFIIVFGVWLIGTSCGRSAPDGSATTSEPPLTITGAEAVERDLSRRVVVTGKVEPFLRVDLASPMQGILAALLVEEGDVVQPGDVLARFDVAEAQAQLDRAKVLLEHASIVYRRSRELLEGNVSSASEYELAAADLNVRRSEVDLWTTRLDFGTVKAPFRGVVTAKHIEAGGAVSLNQPLLELADLSILVVRVGVSEMDVAHLEPNERVAVRFDAHPDVHATGVIRRIFPSADPQTRLFPVEIALDPESIGVSLRFGYLARVEIAVDERPAVLALPVTAMNEDENGPFVRVIDPKTSRVQRRAVVPGIERGGWREIRSGLDAGERVVGSPDVTVEDGALVRVVRWTGGIRAVGGEP